LNLAVQMIYLPTLLKSRLKIILLDATGKRETIDG
jgi:hypothetical protein